MSEKEISEQKKQDSKKFIKIYMLTFLAVIIILLLSSHFAQEKLSNEIESLTHTLGLQELESLSHLSNSEKLEQLNLEHERVLEEQEDLILLQQNAIIEYKEKVANLEEINSLQELNFITLSNLFELNIAYNEGKYENCILLAIQIAKNGVLTNAEYIKIFDDITNDLINLELLTKEQLQK